MMSLETIVRCFRLDGDTLIRVSTGKAVKASKPDGRGYIHVSVGTWGRDGYESTTLHRIKFALAHGYLPPDVDHRSRNKSDNSVSNLRAATRQQNLWNRPVAPGRTLPKGVTRHKNGRYRAALTNNYKRVHLGYFDTVAEAESAVNAYCLGHRGEFHPSL